MSEDVIAPPPGELFSETNVNSVAILLTYGTACVLLAGDAEVPEVSMLAGLFRVRLGAVLIASVFVVAIGSGMIFTHMDV